MPRAMRLFLVGLILGGPVCAPALEASFQFTPLQVPGSVRTAALDINDAGHIVECGHPGLRHQ
jgi:hypothetical protein